MIRYVVYIVLTTITFAMCSCNNKNKELLIGKWQQVDSDKPVFLSVLTFKKDSTATEKIKNRSDGRELVYDSFTYKIDGNDLKLNVYELGKLINDNTEWGILKLDKDSLYVSSLYNTNFNGTTVSHYFRVK